MFNQKGILDIDFYFDKNYSSQYPVLEHAEKNTSNLELPQIANIFNS